MSLCQTRFYAEAHAANSARQAGGAANNEATNYYDPLKRRVPATTRPSNWSRRLENTPPATAYPFQQPMPSVAL